MTNNVDIDQTAPIGAVCSGSKLFACILKFACYVRQLFAADDFSRRHFQMHFSWRFKGSLYIKETYILFKYRQPKSLTDENADSICHAFQDSNLIAYYTFYKGNQQTLIHGNDKC